LDLRGLFGKPLEASGEDTQPQLVTGSNLEKVRAIFGKRETRCAELGIKFFP